jgi:hypothetical protein
MKWKPRLMTVLLAVNLFVLIMPLAGIQVLRIYESALIARTETQLIAQVALVAAAFRDALLRELHYGAAKGPLEYGISIPPRKKKTEDKG